MLRRVVDKARASLDAVAEGRPTDPTFLVQSAMIADEELYFDYFTALFSRSGETRLTMDITPGYARLSTAAARLDPRLVRAARGARGGGVPDAGPGGAALVAGADAEAAPARAEPGLGRGARRPAVRRAVVRRPDPLRGDRPARGRGVRRRVVLRLLRGAVRPEPAGSEAGRLAAFLGIDHREPDLARSSTSHPARPSCPRRPCERSPSTSGRPTSSWRLASPTATCPGSGRAAASCSDPRRPASRASARFRRARSARSRPRILAAPLAEPRRSRWRASSRRDRDRLGVAGVVLLALGVEDARQRPGSPRVVDEPPRWCQVSSARPAAASPAARCRPRSAGSGACPGRGTRRARGPRRAGAPGRAGRTPGPARCASRRAGRRTG